MMMMMMMVMMMMMMMMMEGCELAYCTHLRSEGTKHNYAKKPDIDADDFEFEV